MGDAQWLAEEKGKADAALAEGLVTAYDYEQWCRRLVREHQAESAFSAPARVIPTGKLWIPPTVVASIKGSDLPSKVTINSETGVAENLPQSAKVAGTGEGFARKAKSKIKAREFGCGKAIVLGFTGNGEPVCNRFVVGLTCSDPYKAAAQLARSIVKGGGQAIYGFREAGYELISYKVGETKGGKPVMGLPQLVPSSEVDGVRGSKGLSLIDARTFMQVSCQDRLGWHYAHKLLESDADLSAEWAKAAGAFIPKPKSPKEELDLATSEAQKNVIRTAGGGYRDTKVMAGAMAEEQGGIQVGVEELKSFSCIDFALPGDPSGIPFKVSYRSGEVKTIWRARPNNAIEARNLLFEAALGAHSPCLVTWSEQKKDEPAIDFRLTRTDVLADMPDDSGDEGLEIIRAEYIQASEASCSLDEVSREISEAHSRARLACEVELYLGAGNEAERFDCIQSFEGVDLAPKKLPDYQKPGMAMPYKGDGTSKPHKWAQRAKNSRKGATWDRMMKAQALPPGVI